ncbi:unnamed protein product [Vicia faba]|uniref:Receptor-like PK ALE2 N-terminal domain-containing protein n=1 Tax=Vicia faba TaxID=3906 RepID=A0AAV0Z644_VICFA|nr:unnamed protein product [Vicia faba]
MEFINLVLYFDDMLSNVQPRSQPAVISLIKMSVRVHNKKPPSPSPNVFKVATIIPCKKHNTINRITRCYPQPPNQPSLYDSYGLSCENPLTKTLFGSVCGYVLLMSFLLLLDPPPLLVYQVINELEIELASGTYLKQIQVRNKGKSLVEVNLVPLSDKFDNVIVV